MRDHEEANHMFAPRYTPLSDIWGPTPPSPLPSHTRPGSSDGGESLDIRGDTAATVAPEPETFGDWFTCSHCGQQLGLTGPGSGSDDDFAAEEFYDAEVEYDQSGDCSPETPVVPPGFSGDGPRRAPLVQAVATAAAPGAEPSMRDRWICAACLVALVVIVFAALFIRT